MNLDAVLRMRIFGISPDEATFARRGFGRATDDARRRLETIGRTFIEGYHHALRAASASALAERLEETPHERLGFAYEGAAMGLALRDILGRRTGRLATFRAGPGAGHDYMLTVGAGWALARVRQPLATTLLGRRIRSLQRGLDPVHRWLALDGYGFHQGYFDWRRYLDRGERPRELSGYALHAFDQGLGRSAWFVAGADVAAVAERIGGLATDRHADLWSGVGLAAAYAGAVDARSLARLVTLAGEHRDALAQGAAFAAKARARAGNETPHTELACTVLCGVCAADAAAWTDDAREDLPGDEGASATVPAYEIWRRRIRTHFLARGAA